MNIFMIDADPVQCARSHVDSHVRKMVVEYAQIMSTAHHCCDPAPSPSLYKPTHATTRFMKWAQENSANYLWLYATWRMLQDEHEHRFGFRNASSRLLTRLARLPQKIFRADETTPMPFSTKVLPEWIVAGNNIESQRNYYRYGKLHLHQWTNRPPPAWL